MELFGSIAGAILGVVSALACGLCIWRVRREPAGSVAFGEAFALVLATTVLIVPMFAPYNQVLLAPAIFILVRTGMLRSERSRILPAIRWARAVGFALLLWPWAATLGLSFAYLWLTPSVRQRVWPVPFYANFMLPVFIFGLALLHVWTSAKGGRIDSVRQFISGKIRRPAGENAGTSG
jgi:hypothetical protein